MLKFKNSKVGFKHKSTPNVLFEATSLQFQPGDFIGVIGANGAGKTTLFASLMGEQPLLDGDFYWNEQSLGSLSRQERIKLISFVASKFNGVNHLKVRELIEMGRAPFTNLLHRLSKEDQQLVAEIIRLLGLEALQEKNTLFLSDGERQIAMIGKALAQATEVMILDEPTAFLDYSNRRKILELLQTIANEEKKMVFISSHDLDLCFAYCNRIVAIDKKSKQLVNYSAPFDTKEIIERIF